MKRSARVVNNAQAATTVWVEVEGVSACRRCERGEGCGAGIFNQGSAARIACFTQLPVSADQTVDIEIEEASSSWLWLVAGAYGLPLLGLLLASLAANWIFPILVSTLPIRHALPADAVVGIAALSGLAGGVIAWRLLSTSILARLEKGLCLSSARIVNNSSSSVTPILESPDET